MTKRLAIAVAVVGLVFTSLVLQDVRKATPFFVLDRLRFGGSFGERALWTEKVEVEWKPCPWWRNDSQLSGISKETTGYIKVECTGGLNQMRRDLCDGVGIARLLNATLLIPHFDAASYWNDTSGFAEIFDVDFFINQTKGFVPVVKVLPKELISTEPFFIDCRKRKVPFDYIEEVLPALLKHKVVTIRPAASQRSDRCMVSML